MRPQMNTDETQIKTDAKQRRPTLHPYFYCLYLCSIRVHPVALFPCAPIAQDAAGGLSGWPGDLRPASFSRVSDPFHCATIMVMISKGPTALKAEFGRWYSGAHIPLRVIRRFARQVAARFRPDKIFLFGSHAYGTPHADSDVDILVIMPARNQLDQAFKIRLAVHAE
jgi:hypothetical protein